MKTFLLLWCLVCFVGGVSSSEARSELTYSETLSGWHYLKRFQETGNYLLLHVTFLKDGYAVEQRNERDIESTEIPFQHVSLMRAYLLKENTILKPINSLHDFQGVVQIDSAEKAIEFVRFRTSGRTYYLFRPHIMVEIYKRPAGEEEGSFYGECSPVFFEQHHLKHLEVIEHDGSFEIRRFLLTYSWESPQNDPILYKTIERVTEDGRYMIEQEKVFEGLVFHDIAYPGIPR